MRTLFYHIICAAHAAAPPAKLTKSQAANLTMSSILCGFVFGVFGMWLFKEGKRRTNYQVLLIGIALMVYPYFVKGLWLPWLVGVGLCGLAYLSWTRE